MSEYIHRGAHPDADLLSAFAEGALPEHERLACVDHLAVCPECREIVFLSQPDIADEPVPVPVAKPEPVSFWKRWLVPVSVLSAVAAAAVLIVSITTMRNRQTAAPPPELMAKVETPPLEVPTNVAEVQTEAARASKSAAQPLADNTPSKPKAVTADRNVTSPAPVPLPPPPQAAPAAVALSAPAVAAPVAAPQAARMTNPGLAPNGFLPPAAPPPVELAGVTGKVTDPTGGAVPRAQVELTDTRNKTTTSTTDNAGEYNLAGLPPGHYQLKIQAAGFKRSANELDLQPQQIAKADSKLELGAASETVSVMAEVATVQAAAGAARAGAAPLPARGGGARGGGREPAAFATASATEAANRGALSMDATAESANVAIAPTLPSKLPAVSTVTSGKTTLSTDTNGSLFLSTGKSWKAVKGKWKGKIVRLVTPPGAPNANGAVFQLITDSGEVWLSKDGSKWDSAAAKPQQK